MRKKQKAKNKFSISLKEVFIVSFILFLLLIISLFTINPARTFSKGNNKQRLKDINQIANALTAYKQHNDGQLPKEITLVAEKIGTDDIDICSYLVPVYLKALPVDPLKNTGIPISNCKKSYETDYKIVKTKDNKVTIIAPGSELGEFLSVTK